RDRRRRGDDRAHPRDPRAHHPGPPRRGRPREPGSRCACQAPREARRRAPARNGAGPMSTTHPTSTDTTSTGATSTDTTVLRLDPVPDALAAIAAGRPVVVVDDEDRENEGDLILAASAATPEVIAFAVRYSSGLLCAPLTAERADALELPLMVAKNADPLRTAYTVSVDASEGVTTGISAADRARTLQVLADPATTVAGGTLVVGAGGLGKLGGTLTVGNGATLQGTGSVGTTT